jgi:N-acetyl-anhydromuramyl-L-alanine amidase AmpD
VTTPDVVPVESPSPTPVPKPDILSRQDWNAHPPIGEMKRHTLAHITIHHTASPQSSRRTIVAKMQALQKFSQSAHRVAARAPLKPAWPDVPYHFYVAVDGQIAEGRSLDYAGDTNTDYDPTGHALVVLEGNFENEQPSAQQLRSLYELTLWLARERRIAAVEIKGHKEKAATLCPGRNLQKLLPELRNYVQSR